jgi:hypothetical protein
MSEGSCAVENFGHIEMLAAFSTMRTLSLLTIIVDCWFIRKPGLGRQHSVRDGFDLKSKRSRNHVPRTTTQDRQKAMTEPWAHRVMSAIDSESEPKHDCIIDNRLLSAFPKTNQNYLLIRRLVALSQ